MSRFLHTPSHIVKFNIKLSIWLLQKEHAIVKTSSHSIDYTYLIQCIDLQYHLEILLYLPEQKIIVLSASNCMKIVFAEKTRCGRCTQLYMLLFRSEGVLIIATARKEAAF